PQVWVVAECLRIQGHPEPEKEAIRIMKSEARTSTERTFYRKLLATSTLVLMIALPWANPALAYSTSPPMNGSTSYALCEVVDGWPRCPANGQVAPLKAPNVAKPSPVASNDPPTCNPTWARAQPY